MKKTLEALEIHRDEDGSHVVEHHHAEHPPESHRFKTGNQAVGHILRHIERLSPSEGPPQIEEQEDSQPESWSGRPAGFDHGSTRMGEIQAGRRTVSYTHLTLPTICSV